MRPTAITKIEFPDGHVEKGKKLPPRFRVKRIKAFSDGVTYKATQILEKNVQAGTGTRAQIGCPAAGKTGTTDNFTDAWFVGFTPRLATSVWVGYPTAKIEMRTLFQGGPVAGGTFPAQIWGAYMKQAKGKLLRRRSPSPTSRSSRRRSSATTRAPAARTPATTPASSRSGLGNGVDTPGRGAAHGTATAAAARNGGDGRDNGGTATARRLRPRTSTSRRRRRRRRPSTARRHRLRASSPLPGLVKLARRRGGAPVQCGKGRAGSTTSRIAETS